MTYQLTQGVTKNIIPAIPSTNAIVAAACTLEALKILTDVSKRMDNYMMCAISPPMLKALAPIIPDALRTQLHTHRIRGA